MPLFIWAYRMIRRAQPDDVRILEQIAERAYRPYVAVLGKKPAPMVADFKKHIDDDWVIVFERSAVLGYAILLIEETSILLDNIAVDVDAQKEGIGKALMNHVERHVLDLDRSHLDLYTNVLMTENIRWYRRLGFAETKRIEEKGFKRVYMRKSLGPTLPRSANRQPEQRRPDR